VEQDLVLRKKCPVCDHQGSFSHFLRCTDYTVSGLEFEIVACPECGLKFTNPIPPPESIGKYYESQEYISHSDTKSGLVARAYHFVRNYAIKQKLSLVRKHVARGTLLDYGCGTGAFLHHANRSGWQVLGLEPDPGARERARIKEATVYATLGEVLGACPDDGVNAITMWHVLEHVYDLRETITGLAGKLSDKGLFFIAVPNHRSGDATHYGRFWAAYDVPRHLYHFDIDSITHLFNQSGFSLLKAYPMKFDSYYVSLLSEKYKHGRTRYLPALLRGLSSNSGASKPEEYSSVIYVFGRGQLRNS
jgi:SAM-dependent methyltransferase